MRPSLESWMLALIEERGLGQAEAPGGRAIIAGATTLEPFGEDFPSLDHERFLDAKIALVHLARAGYLKALPDGVFAVTEVGRQRAALERGLNDLQRFPR